MLFYLIPIGILIFSLITVVLIPYKRITSYKAKHIATRFFPILGNPSVPIKSRDFYNINLEIAKKYPGKKIIVTNIGTKAIFSIRDTQYLKTFLQNQQLYKKSDFLAILRPLMGNGLITAEGETWKRHRKIVSATFHYDFLKGNIKTVQDTTKEFLDKTTPEELLNYSGINKIQEITGEIVGRVFFGEKLNNYTFEGKPLTIALADLIQDLSMAGRTPWLFIFGGNVLKLPVFAKYQQVVKRVNNFRKICSDIIEDRRSKPAKGKDLLGALLQTQNSAEKELRFSDTDIIDEFITFFVAGMDTTGHLVAMVLYNLTQHSQWLEPIAKERAEIYKTEQIVTADILAKMDVLHNFIKETLRFHTPAIGVFGREAIQDHKLLDLDIRKGDLVRISFFPFFHNEEHFPQPAQFNPNRWSNQDHTADPYAFTPFSAGLRNCIGQHLAIIEAKVILSEFLERFTFKLKDGYQLKMTTRFLNEPRDELVFNLAKKEIN